VRQALKLAAMSLSRNDSALGAFYRLLCARMEQLRARTAVAHKLARMVSCSRAGRRSSCRRAQAPRVRAWLPDHPNRSGNSKNPLTFFCFSRVEVDAMVNDIPM